MRVENLGFLFARATTEVLAICIEKTKSFRKSFANHSSKQDPKSQACLILQKKTHRSEFSAGGFGCNQVIDSSLRSTLSDTPEITSMNALFLFSSMNFFTAEVKVPKPMTKSSAHVVVARYPERRIDVFRLPDATALVTAHYERVQVSATGPSALLATIEDCVASVSTSDRNPCSRRCNALPYSSSLLPFLKGLNDQKRYCFLNVNYTHNIFIVKYSLIQQKRRALWARRFVFSLGQNYSLSLISLLNFAIQ